MKFRKHLRRLATTTVKIAGGTELQAVQPAKRAEIGIYAGEDSPILRGNSRMRTCRPDRRRFRLVPSGCLSRANASSLFRHRYKCYIFKSLGPTQAIRLITRILSCTRRSQRIVMLLAKFEILVWSKSVYQYSAVLQDQTIEHVSEILVDWTF